MKWSLAQLGSKRSLNVGEITAEAVIATITRQEANNRNTIEVFWGRTRNAAIAAYKDRGREREREGKLLLWRRGGWALYRQWQSKENWLFWLWLVKELGPNSVNRSFRFIEIRLTINLLHENGDLLPYRSFGMII